MKLEQEDFFVFHLITSWWSLWKVFTENEPYFEYTAFIRRAHCKYKL